MSSGEVGVADVEDGADLRSSERDMREEVMVVGEILMLLASFVETYSTKDGKLLDIEDDRCANLGCEEEFGEEIWSSWRNICQRREVGGGGVVRIVVEKIEWMGQKN